MLKFRGGSSYLGRLPLCFYFHPQNGYVSLSGACIQGDDDVVPKTLFQHFLLVTPSCRDWGLVILRFSHFLKKDAIYEIGSLILIVSERYSSGGETIIRSSFDRKVQGGGTDLPRKARRSGRRIAAALDSCDLYKLIMGMINRQNR